MSKKIGGLGKGLGAFGLGAINKPKTAIAKAKPAAAKGTYFKSASIATTMGPGIKVSTAKF